MSTLNAASRLRNVVLNIPGTVLLTQAGHVDRVVRFQKIPDIIEKLKRDFEETTNRKHVHAIVNLDMGPGQEAWRGAMRDVNRTARRDIPIPEPVPVSAGCKEDWAVAPEDVPVIENGIEVVTPTATKAAPSKPESFAPKCEPCNRTFASEHGLTIHNGSKHKEK